MDNATEDQRPLWQMDVRHSIGLAPEHNDPVSRHLFAVLYSASNRDEFAAKLEQDIGHLQAKLKEVRGA